MGFISPQESAVFWKKSLSLENIIPYLEADTVLVEGFEKEKTYPKIVCLRGEPDDADRDQSEDLFDGLAICAVGPADQMGGVAVPLLRERPTLVGYESVTSWLRKSVTRLRLLRASTFLASV